MKIGFLPLYIKLYDRTSPTRRAHLQETYEGFAKMIEARGIEVVRSELCCLKPEFEAEVAKYEKEGCDAIVTWHAAYSPSLESIDAICNTNLPVVVLDTTETLTFTNEQDPDMIGLNHGIHGVMDFCSMLTRRKKPYAIAAGHVEVSDVIDRVCGFVRSIIAANAIKTMTVGLVGGAFEGMGDFTVDYNELDKLFGIKIEQMDAKRLSEIYNSVTAEEIEAEKAEYVRDFDFKDNIQEKDYTESVKSCLAIRKYVAEKKYGAFSVNFTQTCYEKAGITSMPFVEACKSMARGIGYAGEGDGLTAAFTGAFIKAWPNATFCEIFCPDWVHGLVLLSHMGEVNYRLADSRPLFGRQGTNFTPGEMPYSANLRFAGGTGVYTNISRDADGYRITCSEAELIHYDNDNFPSEVRGWMKLRSTTTANFLESLSRNGATHHSVFVTGATAEQIEFFGKLLNIPVTVIKS